MDRIHGFTTAPTLDDIARLGESALTTIPRHLARMVEGVVLRVDDFPDDGTCAEMELESPFDLLGLYVGTPFGEKSVNATPTTPDMIFLYRRPLLDYWCETGEDLSHLVRHVLIHEIGHHFGFSDDEMDALEQQQASPVMRIVALAVGIGLGGQAAAQGFDPANCSFDGIPLHGDVQVVTSFPDITVQQVTSFPHLNVQIVSSFPDNCGQWRFVTSFPDFTIQFVNSFPDVQVRYVTSFPGVP